MRGVLSAQQRMNERLYRSAVVAQSRDDFFLDDGSWASPLSKVGVYEDSNSRTADRVEVMGAGSASRSGLPRREDQTHGSQAGSSTALAALRVADGSRQHREATPAGRGRLSGRGDLGLRPSPGRRWE